MIEPSFFSKIILYLKIEKKYFCLLKNETLLNSQIVSLEEVQNEEFKKVGSPDGKGIYIQCVSSGNIKEILQE